MKSTGGEPTEVQVRQQLQRMLESTRFLGAEAQAKLLKKAVELRLANEETTEQALGAFIVGEGFDPKIDGNVRKNARDLRRTITRYNANEGKEDYVHIVMPVPPKDDDTGKRFRAPEGAAYRPEFYFNPRHPARRLIDTAHLYLAQDSPHQVWKALQCTEKARDLVPHDPLFYIEMGWCFLALARMAEYIPTVEEIAPISRLLPGWSLATDDDRRAAYFAAVDTLLLKTADMNVRDDFLPALFLAGARCFLEHRYTDAKNFYEYAISVSSQEIVAQDLVYKEVVALSGLFDEAVSLAKAQADEQHDNINVQTHYASLLMLVRRFAEAEKVLKDALDLHPHSLHANFALLRLYKAIGRTGDYNRLNERTRSLMHEANLRWFDSEFPPL